MAASQICMSLRQLELVVEEEEDQAEEKFISWLVRMADLSSNATCVVNVSPIHLLFIDIEKFTAAKNLTHADSVAENSFRGTNGLDY